MISFRRASLLAPLILVLGTASGALAQIEIFGSLPSAAVQTRVLSADGRVVAGTIPQQSQNGTLTFRFSNEGGLEVLGTINGTTALPVDVSDDGRYIAGNVSASRAVRWGDDGVPLDLGTIGLFDTRATGISGDGTTVVGSAQIQMFNPSYRHAFGWTEAAGMLDLHPSFGPPVASSDATDVNGDGTVIVGWTTLPTASGIGQRTAFRWTAASGATDIDAGSADFSEALGVSDDGSVVVGRGRFGSARLQPWVWTAATGMIPLGEVGSCLFPDVNVSADGSTVYGVCSPDGFRWTQAVGRQDFTGPSRFEPYDSSDDGEVLVGAGTLGGTFLVGAYWTPGLGVSPQPGLPGSFVFMNRVNSEGTLFAGAASISGSSFGALWRLDGTIGESYCAPAAANSVSATGARLTLGGTNASQLAALELSVTDLPQQSFGFFLVSRERDLIAMPGGSQGTLCLGANIGRFVGPGQIQNSGSEGAFDLSINLSSLPSPTGPVLPSFGETWHFQAWYRDANPGLTSNFSSAASIALF